MYEFNTPTPVNLFARVSAGTLEITAEPRDTAVVEVLPWDTSSAARDAAERTRVELRGDRLDVETPDSGIGFLFRRSARLHVRVRVPIDSALQVKIASAELRGQGRYASASISSASGEVAVEHVTGEATVKTASGPVLIDRVDGRVSCDTASGDVTVTRAGGDLVAHTASGDVTVDNAQASAKITTASGSLRIGAARQGAISLKSASGGMSVGVAQGTSVWLDLHSTSGRTRSDLAMSETPPTGSEAGLTLRIVSASGDIDVHRVTSPASAALPLRTE